MNTYTWLGAGELLLGAFLLFGCSIVATNLPDWLIRPGVMRSVALVTGLVVLAGSIFFFIQRLQEGFLSWRATIMGAAALAVLFYPRAALEEQALRLAETASRWHIDRRLTAGIAVVGAVLLLIGLATLVNGLQGFTS